MSATITFREIVERKLEEMQKLLKEKNRERDQLDEFIEDIHKRIDELQEALEN